MDLTGVRRQFTTWQQRQSENFGEARTAAAISSYVDHGVVAFSDDRKTTIQRAVRDYVADMARSRHELAEGSNEQSAIALAYTQEDVRMLNQHLRTALRNAGETQAGPTGADHQWQVRIPEDHNRFRNEERQFANGDKIMFLQNNAKLGVLNGMIGSVETVTARQMKVRLPDIGGQPGKTVNLVNEARNDRNEENYLQIDHGYAITIHKSQGGTWDRSYVVASERMDSHLSYVAMTRHRTSVQIYASRDEFVGADALVRGLSRRTASSLPPVSQVNHEEQMSKLTTEMERLRVSPAWSLAPSDTNRSGMTESTDAQEKENREIRGRDTDLIQQWRMEVSRQRPFDGRDAADGKEASRQRSDMVRARSAHARDGGLER